MDRITEDKIISQHDLELCEIFIYHNPEWLAFCLEPYLDAYEKVLATVPGRAIKIGLPLPQFFPFWPFHANDPRNVDTVRYPYGDTFIIELLREGLPPEEIISRYLTVDLATRLDLDALLSSTIMHMRRSERASSVKVGDFVEQNFRNIKIFSTVNHGANKLLYHFTNQILKILDCPPISEKMLDSLDVLVGTEMPVHPSIARHFGANYINESTIYMIEKGRHQNFEGYIRDYVYYS
jgi:hypothetical protein